jgi:hypothetical protein
LQPTGTARALVTRAATGRPLALGLAHQKRAHTPLGSPLLAPRTGPQVCSPRGEGAAAAPLKVRPGSVPRGARGEPRPGRALRGGPRPCLCVAIMGGSARCSAGGAPSGLPGARRRVAASPCVPLVTHAPLAPPSCQKLLCPRGDECPCTHSLFEFWLHPDRWGLHCPPTGGELRAPGEWSRRADDARFALHLLERIARPTKAPATWLTSVMGTSLAATTQRAGGQAPPAHLPWPLTPASLLLVWQPILGQQQPAGTAYVCFHQRPCLRLTPSSARVASPPPRPLPPPPQVPHLHL